MPLGHSLGPKPACCCVKDWGWAIGLVCEVWLSFLGEGGSHRRSFHEYVMERAGEPPVASPIDEAKLLQLRDTMPARKTHTAVRGVVPGVWQQNGPVDMVGVKGYLEGWRASATHCMTLMSLFARRSVRHFGQTWCGCQTMFFRM